MYFQTIAHGLVTVQLSAQDCRNLAQACDAALDMIGTDEYEELQPYVATAYSAFAAAARLADAQGRLPIKEAMTMTID